MRNPDRDLPEDLRARIEAFEAAVESEQMDMACGLLEDCKSTFCAAPRTASNTRSYINWLGETIERVRISREHFAKRIVDTSTCYSMGFSGAAPEPQSRSGWLGILAVVLVILPCNLHAGDPQSSIDKQMAAAQRQRQSTQTRRTSDGFFQTRWMDDPSTPAPAAASPAAVSPIEGDCPAVPAADLQAMISRMSLGPVSPKLVNAVISQESGGKPCAVSSKGAKGLMQIMPDLAADMNISDPFDPEQNLRAGIRYLAQLSEKYRGDLRLVLAAYNAGPARVDASGGVPEIAETQAYVKSILSRIGSAD